MQSSTRGSFSTETLATDARLGQLSPAGVENQARTGNSWHRSISGYEQCALISGMKINQNHNHACNPHARENPFFVGSAPNGTCEQMQPATDAVLASSSHLRNATSFLSEGSINEERRIKGGIGVKWQPCRPRPSRNPGEHVRQSGRISIMRNESESYRAIFGNDDSTSTFTERGTGFVLWKGCVVGEAHSIFVLLSAPECTAQLHHLSEMIIMLRQGRMSLAHNQ